MKRTTLVLTVFAAAMVMALMMVAMALPVFAGGADDDEEENESASGSPTRNGQIVFRRWFDPDQTKGALFTMNPDGSHVRQITHPPKGWRDESPVWSPNGTKVAFERQRIDESMSRIMLIDLKTGDTREVTHCGPNQGQPKQGPPGRCESDFDPAFSPDGRSIAFQRILVQDKPCCWLQGIWIVGADGSNPHQVTNVEPKLPAEFEDFGPAFSPNGKMLVFDRSRVADERHAVFVQPLGSPEDAHRITPWKLNCQDHPEFSPDGKLVLFRCLPKGEDGPANLYWVHPDGTGLHPLTHAPADKQYLGTSLPPSFS